MPPDKRNGPLGTTPESRSNAQIKASTPSIDSEATGADRPCVAVGAALAYEPCARRRMFHVAVSCPHCGGTHFHRVYDLAKVNGSIRRPGCTPGARYVVAVTAIQAPERGAA